MLEVQRARQVAFSLTDRSSSTSMVEIALLLGFDTGIPVADQSGGQSLGGLAQHLSHAFEHVASSLRHPVDLLDGKMQIRPRKTT